MQVRKKFLQRAMCLLLAIVCVVGACGLDVLAACPGAGTKAEHHVGYYTLVNHSNGPVGIANHVNQPSAGTPTHSLCIQGVWTPAWCMDSTRHTKDGAIYSAMSSWSGISDNKANYAILATLLQRAVVRLGVCCGQGTEANNITVRGGNTLSDAWVCTQYLVWGFRKGGLMFFQGDGAIGITDTMKGDLNNIVKVIKNRRPNDGNALVGTLASLYNDIACVYWIPWYASYDPTSHPAGVAQEYTWALDKLCKQTDPTTGKTIYTKTIVNGRPGWVQSRFDFTKCTFPGKDIRVTQDNVANTITLTYYPEDEDCAGFDSIFSSTVNTTVPIGWGSLCFWERGGDQRLVTFTPDTSEFGARLKVRCDVECSHDEPSPSNFTGDETITPGTATPSTTTPDITITKAYLKKESDNGKVEGFEFVITGGGKEYRKVTDANGIIDVSDLPMYVEDGTGNPDTRQLITYHAEEVIPVEYVHDKDNASKNFELSPGSTTVLKFYNKTKKWRLTFKKHDESLGTQAQGKGSLAGAKFALYKDDQFLAEYVTDENGMITTDYWPCGPGYTLTEISAPPGYQNDSTVYAVGLLPSETVEEYNQCNRMEPLDGDDPDVIRRAYSLQSALKYKAESEMYEHLN